MNLYFYSTSTSLLSSLRKFLVLIFVAIFSFGYSYAQVPARGLSFDGVDDYVNIPVKPALNISSSITLEAWIFPRTTDGSGVQDVICKSSADVNDGYVFPRTTDGWNNLEFLISINGYGWQLLSVPYGMSKLNQWHHLAATYDGFEMRIYIDGVLAGSKPFTGTIAVNNNPLVISGQTNFFNEYFKGSVDEVKVWNRALTQCEIAQTMNCELPAGQNGLAAYYKFNNGVENADNTGLTQVIDESGNGANGSLTNFALNGAISNWASGNVSGTCGVLTSVTATATSTPAILASNGNVQLSATGGGTNGTYAWTGPNGFTSTLQNPILSAVNKNHSGNYNVVVTNNGCQATASTTLTVADLGSALKFNGVDNYITVPNNPQLNSNRDLSIEAWVNPAANFPVIQDIVAKSTSFVHNNTGYILRTDDGWTNFSFWLHINGQWRVISAPFPGLNQWHHIAATYDGFFMKIYLDGVLSNTLSIAGAITTNNNDLTIGQQEGGVFEHFNGSLDELRIWNKALTQCEIQNNLNCQLNGKVNAANPLGIASQTGLAAYYRFNQGLAIVDNNSLTALSGIDINAVNILVDSSVNHNNGVLHGFALNGTTSNWVVGGAVNNSTCSQFTPSTATVISNGPTIEVGTTLSMSATGGTGWLWTGPNGFTSNQQSISIPNAQTSHSGNYAVSITGAGGCTLLIGTNMIVAYKAGTLDLDGVDDMVTVPVTSSSSSLNIAKEITLESWIFPTNGTTQVQDIMSKSTQDVNTGYIFPRTDDGWKSFVFYLHVNGVWQKLSAPLPANPLNKWHHLAATYDGFYMRVYLNGVLTASQQVSGSITLNNNDLVIGQQPGFFEYFSGRIEEARIWNRALNQCEIINNMTCEIDLTSPIATNGLAAYYKFNEGFVDQDNSAFTTLTDASANANNGTLQNFALQGSSSTWTAFQVNGTCTVLTDPPVTATANGSVFGVGSTIKLFANGGTNPISFTWDGPNAYASFVQNPTITNAQPNESGVYTVTAKFVKCEVKASTRVTVSALRPISADGPTTFCPSSSVTLSSSNSGVAYQWYKNDVAITGATSNKYVAAESGDYTVTVDDGQNILVTVPITVLVIDNQAPQPVVAQLPTLTIEIPGANIPAVISAYPTAIDNCRGTITATTTDPVSYNAVGTYSVTWTYNDQNGNITQQTQQINVVKATDIIPPVINLPANQTLSANLATCGAIANFAATASDNSGYPVAIAYSVASGSLFAVGNTTVTVTATDAASNITTGNFIITVLPTVVAPVTGATNVCVGSTITLATASTGGTWSSSNTAIATVNGTTGVVTGVTPGNADIIYTNQCGATASATVVVSTLAAPVITASGATTFCAPGSVVLTSSAATGNTWSTGETTQSITVSASGNYSVTLINGVCSATSSATTVVVNPTPATPIITASGSTTFCAPGSVVLTSSAATGNTWSTGETTQSITVTTSGNYNVTVSNGSCTASSAATTVTVNTAVAAPTVTVSGPTTFCTPGSVTLTSSSLSGNTWSTGEITESITVSTTGNYSVSVSNGFCSATSASVAVTANPTPATPIITASGSTTFCAPGSVVLTSSSATGNTWSTGETTQSITVTASGNYSVTVSNGLCSASSAAATVIVNTAVATPTISVSGSTTFCAPGSVVLTSSAATGNTWSTGETTQSITVTASGNYSVTVSNGFCAATSASVPVTVHVVPAVPTITASGSTTFCAPGSVVLTSSAATGNTWSTGETTQSITVNTSGNYSVSATNGFCTSANSPAVTVTVNEAPVVPTITASGATAFCAPGSVVLTSSAATGNTWSTGETTSSITVSTTGNYSVTVTNGLCSANAAAVAVTVNALPVVAAINGNTSVNIGAVTQLSNSTPGGAWTSSSANVTVNSNGLVTGVAAGTATISYTVTNSAGCATTVTAEVTVNDVPVCNVLPVATITESDPNTFCNNIVLTGSSSASGATYKWVSGTAVISTSAQITLDQSAGDGIYQLYVTANGCTSEPAAYNFQKQNLVNSYTILAYKEAEFDKYNKVISGSVGVMSAKGEAEFKSYSAVNGTGAFVKAPKIDKDGSGINIPNQIIGVATVTLPTMQYNTASTYKLPNYTASQNNANLSGNYKNLTIKKGISVTVSGTTFGNIKLEEGASIRFLSSVLNIDNLTAYRGAKNNSYTYIYFAPNTSVRVKSKVTIGSQVLVNPESNRVTFYMSDLRHDEEKFTVKGEDTRVIANVFMPNGKLRVTAGKSEEDDHGHGEEDHDRHGKYEGHDDDDDEYDACDHKTHNAKNCKHKGHDHNDCDHKAHDAFDCGDNVYMTGFFIAEKVESKGNAVIWSNYDCNAAAPYIPTMKTVTSVKQQVTSEAVEPAKPVAIEEELKITVMPNPSTTYFTLKLESKYQTPVTLRVMDASGRVVDAKSKIASNSTFQIGANYNSGTYYAEMIQGTHRKVVQLIKVRG